MTLVRPLSSATPLGDNESAPPSNRDPFDRVLLSQAQIEGMSLLTRDAAVLRYGALAMAI